MKNAAVQTEEGDRRDGPVNFRYLANTVWTAVEAIKNSAAALAAVRAV